MFLPSTTEVGLANENSIAEGSLWALFTTADSSRLAYPTAEAVANSNYTNANLAETKHGIGGYERLRFLLELRSHVSTSGALNEQCAPTASTVFALL